MKLSSGVLKSLKNRGEMALAPLLWRVNFDKMIIGALPRHDPKLAEVYDRRGIALIHIPKNAGTSVERFLYGDYSVKHRKWQEVRALDPEGWKRWKKVAIIREPVDRFLSAFDYLSGGGRNEYDARFGQHVIAGQSVNSFVHQLVQQPQGKRILSYFHFEPQSAYVMNGDEVVVDKLIPLERLREELPRFAGVTDTIIPVANKTSGNRTLKEELTFDSLRILENVYEKDFILYEQACRGGEEYLTRAQI